MRALPPLASVLLLLLAGCSGGDSPAAAAGGAVAGPGERVEGVIVSAAIVPLEGAAVALAPLGRTAVSDAGGRFAFDGVPAGDYFVTATFPGYIPAQTTVRVEEGQAPPLVQVVLDADRDLSPYFEAYTYAGYLDLSFAAGPASGSLSGIFAEGDLGTSYNLPGRLPDWVQVEMVWTPTSALSQAMQLTVSPQNGSAVQTIAESADGPSPLAVGFGRAVLEEWEVEGGAPLAVTAFVGNNTPPPAPAAGLAFMQPFDFFTHFFYGYTPPEGWRFSTEGATPPPPRPA